MASKLFPDRCVLVCVGVEPFCSDFWGHVEKVTNTEDVNALHHHERTYLCGDLNGLSLKSGYLAVLGHATNVPDGIPIVVPGQVPRTRNGVGVFYPCLFPDNKFDRLVAEHAFQTLTESDKPGVALRKGIYLTQVEQDADETHFRLLRCSSNLSGPTESFTHTDNEIVHQLNDEASVVFNKTAAPLNHVLAQVYENIPVDEEHARQAKAKIKAHSDKTKDMPSHAIMAFVTFYTHLERTKRIGEFDYGYKGQTALTRLHWRRKDGVNPDMYPERFDVVLYPGSVFMIPLETNRLYTHEIRPSALDVGRIPTRMGYVVRCSDTEAVHTRGKTYVKSNGQRLELMPPTPADMKTLRDKYFEENRTTRVVDYQRPVLFSMNQGDYLCPIIPKE